MLDDATETALRTTLVTSAGGYLRNPVRRAGQTCSVCTTPVEGYARCFACSLQSKTPGLADRVAALTYAVAGQQSGHVMRGYKARSAIAEHYQVVAMFAIYGVAQHADCAARLAGLSITHWASVPSLPAKPGEHPVHRIVHAFAPGDEAGLGAAAEIADDGRALNPDHFHAPRLPPGAHVLLIDDTWTSGGHVQSAALALRAAGARQISTLVVARWLNSAFGGSPRLLREIATTDFDPTRCPWTGSACP